MRIGYYLDEAVDIYRNNGFWYLLRASSRYLSYRLVGESTRFVLRTRIRFLLQRLRYDAPRDPFETISVDPNEIALANYELSQYRGLGLVRSGDWDAESSNVPVEDYWSVKGIRERYLEGRDWEETEYYSTAAEQIAETGEFWRYEDIDEFEDQRCSYVDALFEDIEQNGYVTNSEKGHDVPETLYKQKPHQQREVLVSIGRDGEILLRDGHHRLAIAQILDIDQIPVNVLARHSRWQALRDRVSTTGSGTAPSGRATRHVQHPDLADVTSENS